MKRDPRIDAYIAHAAPFARPILTRLRAVVHAACPEVEETLKLRTPSFTYHGLLCGMAAFKQHCTFGFWKGALIVDQRGGRGDEAMGQFGRITRLSDLPSNQTLTRYIKRAMKLNEDGVKVPMRPKRPKKPLAVPADFTRALARNRAARATFEAFSSSHQREYLEWITEAQGVDTRKRRLETAVEWMAEGKARNWKYM